MAGHLRLLGVVLALGVGTSAFAATTVNENFNTDPSGRGWSGVMNRHIDAVTGIEQDYGWSGDAASPTPPLGMEFSMGGRLQRENHALTTPPDDPPGHANFYGLDLGGSIDISTDSFSVSGVIHLQAPDGGSGFSIGYGTGLPSYTDPSGEKGDHRNFIGLNFDNGIDGGAILWSDGGGRGHNGWVEGDLVVGTTVPFSIAYNGATHIMTSNVNGTITVKDWGSDVNDLAPLTHFQIMPVSANGARSIVWLDDLSLTAVAAVPEPASLGMLSLAGLAALRRRRRA